MCHFLPHFLTPTHALSAHTHMLDVTKPHFPTAGHTTAAQDHTLLSSYDLGCGNYPHIMFHLIRSLKPMTVIYITKYKSTVKDNYLEQSNTGKLKELNYYSIVFQMIHVISSLLQYSRMGASAL